VEIRFETNAGDYLNAQTAHMRSKVAYNLLWILGAALIVLGVVLLFFVGKQLAFPLLGLGIFIWRGPCWSSRCGLNATIRNKPS